MPVPDARRAAAAKSPDSPGKGEPPATAPTKILQAAARRVREAGLVRLSMQDIADEANVSKGLIHYHFRDRDALLARLIEWLAEDIMAREQAALDGCAPHEAIDALWRWIDGELSRGEIRVLLELQQDPATEPALAARRVSRLRHAQAEATTTRLFAMLGLTPRVPGELMAGVAVAFLDGLAMETSLQPDREARISFDVFWLALLSLAE